MLVKVLGILFVILLLVSYFVYLKQTKENQSTPNPAAWIIWLLVDTINAFTYDTVQQGDFWKTIASRFLVLLCLIAFIYFLFKRKFSKLTYAEIIALIGAVAIGVRWQILKTIDEREANILLQVIYLISYGIVIDALLQERAQEKPLAWCIAMVAYLMVIIQNIVSYNGDWVSFLFPVVNGIVGNGAVIATIYYFNKNKDRSPIGSP